MPRRDRPTPRRSLPLNRTFRPDTVLLRRELRWTAATALALGVLGHAAAGAHGAAIGAGTGFLLQQAAYRLIVRMLWHGWQTRCIALEGDARAETIARVSLRAFTLWMRTASANEQLYVALWNAGADKNESEAAGSTAEVRIRRAYSQAFTLEDVPLRCDNAHRRRLRRSLQRDEARLLRLATGERIDR